MKTFLRLHFVAIAVFLALDALWLGIIAKDFYRIHLGAILPLSLAVVPALIFYLLFTAGIVFFAVEPAIQKKSLRSAFVRGALFGLVTYGTYDLTNHASIHGWPIIVTIVDMSWGCFLTALVTAATFWVGRRWTKKSEHF